MDSGLTAQAVMTLPEALERLTSERDPDAWEALLLHSGLDILRVSRRILRDEALAEDACQETLLQIREHARVFKAPPNVAGAADAERAAKIWVMRTACNVALRMLRSRGRTKLREQRHAQDADLIDRNGPEQHTMNDEQSNVLWRELSSLAEEHREPVVLRYFAELDYPALSRALGCTDAAAKKRVQRGIERLRLRLAGAGLVFSLLEVTTRLESGIHALHGPAAPAAAPGFVQSDALAAQKLQDWNALLQSPAQPKFSAADLFPPSGTGLRMWVWPVASLVLLGLLGAATFLSYGAGQDGSRASAAKSDQTTPAIAPDAASPDRTRAVDVAQEAVKSGTLADSSGNGGGTSANQPAVTSRAVVTTDDVSLSLRCTVSPPPTKGKGSLHILVAGHADAKTHEFKFEMTGNDVEIHPQVRRTEPASDF